MIGALAALVLASGWAYAVGPWDAEPAPTGTPRPTARPVSAGPRALSILGAGDILIHPELTDQARRDGGGQLEFGPIFAGAAPAISSADLALCHLETPIAPAGGPYSGFPRFSVPREVVRAIKDAGFDGCSTASNHSLDQGAEGIGRTLNALDEAKLGHAGTHRTAEEAEQPRIYRVKGTAVAHLSYTMNFNGLKRPAGQEWMANLIQPPKIKRDAAAARAAGAEIVVVSLHWGTEYEHEPDVDQQTWARKVAAMRDVDVVLGHHAHVVQPVEKIGDTWIVYGMGNQIARHEQPINENREGAMVRLTFVPAGAGRWKVSALEALPVFVDLNPDIRLIDLERALADPGISPGRRRIYEAAVERIHGHLSTRVVDTAGLVLRGAGPAPAPLTR